MIFEALHYAASYFSTPKVYREHIHSSVSLWSRGRRCAQEWETHNNNCRDFVFSIIGKMKRRRTVVVLGSGCMKDIPLKHLSHAFDTVVLIDLVHIYSVRRAARRIKKANVVIHNRSISDLDAILAGNDPEPLEFLRNVPYLDLVISANVLSQIGIAAVSHLESQGRDREIDILLPRLIRGHIDRLSSLPCDTCLLTDVSFNIISKDGSVMKHTDLLHGVSPPPHQMSWNWDVAPLGEEDPNYLIQHNVIAAKLA